MITVHAKICEVIAVAGIDFVLGIHFVLGIPGGSAMRMFDSR